jgi:GT2 family glycosyltransferase
VPDNPRDADVLVVVPTLGQRPEYLREALASIRSQDVAATIAIVAPPGITHVTSAAEEFKAHLLQDPGSLPAAINHGVATCSPGHAFVTWLNDDDLLTPGSLTETTRLLTENPHATVAFGSCAYIDETGRELWTSRAGSWAPRVLGWGPDLIPQPGMLVRTLAWRDVGGLDTSYRLAFDLDLLLKLKRLGPLINTDMTVSKFRWHGSSLTVDDRHTNIRESERAKRIALNPRARRLAWIWERPVRVATRLAAKEVQRRARKGSSTAR